MADPADVKIGNYVRHTHGYGYRGGEWAVITAFEDYSPDGHKVRECLTVEFADGDTDLWPLSDLDHYEIVGPGAITTVYQRV